MNAAATPAPRALAMLLCALAWGACRPAPVRPADTSPLPAPEAALALLREGGEARRNLRALGRLTSFGADGRVRVKVVLLAERPARLRFETISPLEQPLDVMTTDGSRLYLLSKERLAIGPATPENVGRLLPFPMHPEELVDTLLGGVPTSARFTPARIAWNEAHDRWLLGLDGVAGDRAELTADPARRVVTALELRDPSGEVRLGVTFDDFEPAGSVGELPHTIKLALPGRGVDVDLRLKEVEVNVALDEALFRLTPPPGVRPEPLDSPPAQVFRKPTPAPGDPAAAPGERGAATER